MNDNKLATIAKQHLGIETLAVRNSDSLDFYDLGVSRIKTALEAAYRAGQDAQIITPASNDNRTMFLISAGNIDEVIPMIVASSEAAIPEAIAEFLEATGCDLSQILVDRIGESVPVSNYNVQSVECG